MSLIVSACFYDVGFKKKKTGHYNSCSPTLQLSNVSACARPRRTVSDLAAADGVTKLYGHFFNYYVVKSFKHM
jgi:hypothetical protein